jgi:hypothetical protein
VQKVSKEELLSFYDRYINPSSPSRSVLSVHVTSQIPPPASHFTEQLLEGIKFFVASEGYDLNPSEIAAAIQGDLDLLPQKLCTLLVSKGYEKMRVELSMAKGSDILKAQTGMNGLVHPSGGNGLEGGVKEVRVTDLPAFKNTLRKDVRPMPVQPLETFYESGSPKL